ncbi:MAG: hypothetical protein NTU62_02610 [Spirochaetes bacterium]|nr:hypothetical protein [Spirochaetota bacterium]
MAERELRDEVPRIRRARGFRLYDVTGRRLLDLWQACGEAILGHRTAHAGSALKAALDRGLAAPLPTAWESRLISSLAARFPSYRSFRLFTTRERALEAASRVLGAPVTVDDVADPGLGTRGAGQAGLWRPFLGEEPDWPVLLPVLPFTLGGSPAAACFRVALPDDAEPSDSVPGVAAVAALRGLAGLARARPVDPFGPRDLEGAPGWERRGPYVRPVFAAGAYPQVFRTFLARGVLLSPFYPGPSILPGEASEGERRLVASLFHSIPGG